MSKGGSSSKGKSRQATSSASFEVTNPTVEVVLQNQKMLKKVDKLLRAVRPESVTPVNKEDLDRIQLLIKNIQYRNFGVLERVRPVSYTARQKAIIRLVAGDAAANVPVAGNAGKQGEEPQPASLSLEFEKLVLVPTKQ